MWKTKSLAVMSTAVCIFKIRASSKAIMMKMWGISLGSNAIIVFKTHDLRCVKVAAIKIIAGKETAEEN